MIFRPCFIYFFSILGEWGGWVLESMENSILFFFFLKPSLSDYFDFQNLNWPKTSWPNAYKAKIVLHFFGIKIHYKFGDTLLFSSKAIFFILGVKPWYKELTVQIHQQHEKPQQAFEWQLQASLLTSPDPPRATGFSCSKLPPHPQPIRNND